MRFANSSRKRRGAPNGPGRQPSLGGGSAASRISRLETAAKILAAIATIVGAVVAVWKLFPSPDPPQTIPEVRRLIWGPTDCGSERPEVFIGTCDTKPMLLEWLRGQLMFLKKMGVAGFAELPDEMRLDPRSLGGERNRLLYLVGGSREFTIGVGYDSTRNLKDGGLRPKLGGIWTRSTRPPRSK